MSLGDKTQEPRTRREVHRALEAVALAAAAPAEAAPTRAGLPRLRLVDRQGPAVHLGAVQRRNRGLGLGVRGHLHEAKASTLSRGPICDHVSQRESAGRDTRVRCPCCFTVGGIASEASHNPPDQQTRPARTRSAGMLCGIGQEPAFPMDERAGGSDRAGVARDFVRGKG